MPELPEVETIRRQLDEALVGKIIARVEVLREKSFQAGSNEMIGREIEGVERRSKMLIIRFKNWEKVLTIHLKMTGQLVFRSDKQNIAGGHPTADWVKELPSKHTRVIINFKDSSRLFFNDMRVFGWIRLNNINDHEISMSKLPPDVNDEKFSLDYFRKMIGSSSRPIKIVLLDQQKMGGIGNIYANDALFLAGIDPRRASKDLNDSEIKRLHKAVREVIAKGIKYGGATAADDKFVNVAGMGGKYQEHFLVYGRTGEKCKKCGSEIQKIRLGGRGTYICPKCQI